MNEVFEHLMTPIDRYGGTLARLMGDAIFALFGAPTAHEDDPERAVSAGLAIVDAIRRVPGNDRRRPRSERSRRHQHGAGRRRRGRLGSPGRVHGHGRRGQRRRPHGADGRAGHGADHGRHRSSPGRGLRPRTPEGHRGQRQGGADRRASRAGAEAALRIGGRIGCARDAARGTRRRDGDAAASGRRGARGSRGDGRADRRARSGEEPSDRGDARLLVDPPTADRARRRETSAGSGRSGSASRSTRRGPTRSTGGCSRRSPASPTRTRRTSCGTSSRRRSNRGLPSGSSRTCACGVRSSACPSPGRIPSKARPSDPPSWIWSRGRPATSVPTRACWSSRTSIGATRRRWTS